MACYNLPPQFKVASTHKSSEPRFPPAGGNYADRGHADVLSKPKVPRRLQKALQRIVLLVLLVLALALFFIQVRQWVRSHTGGLDFEAFYTAGKIVNRGQASRLYNIALQQKTQLEAGLAGPFMAYYHPPFEALLFAPFASLSYVHAFLLWAALNLVCLCLTVYLLRFAGRPLGAGPYAAWLAVGLSLALGVFSMGQDTLFLALVFLACFLALKNRRDTLAGLIMGAGLFRFEIFLPFMFVFLLRRRWKVLAGFCLAALLVSLASVALVGWSGIYKYSVLLQEVGRVRGSVASGVPTAEMPTLRGVVATFLGGMVPATLLFPFVFVGTLLLLCWAAWQFRSITTPDARAFDLEFSLTVVAALLSSYHLFVHELTPLIVVGYLMLGYESARPREGLLGNRRCTALLFLFASVFFVGAYARFRDFSVEFIVLFGLMIWLSQEIGGLRRVAASP